MVVNNKYYMEREQMISLIEAFAESKIPECREEVKWGKDFELEEVFEGFIVQGDVLVVNIAVKDVEVENNRDDYGDEEHWYSLESRRYFFGVEIDKATYQEDDDSEEIEFEAFEFERFNNLHEYEEC